MKVTYGTMSFLYKFGTTEDGEDYIGTMTHVVASTADGRRFIKADVAFPSCRRFDSGDGVRSFEDLREQAEEQAHKLAQSLKILYSILMIGKRLQPLTALPRIASKI